MGHHHLEQHYAEKDISAEEETSQPRSWVHEAHAQERWPSGPEAPPPEGTQASHRLGNDPRPDWARIRFCAKISSVMLQKRFRLSADSDIEKAFRTGRSVRSRLVGCKVIYKEEGDSRFAFVVSTKISKSAVVRNRIKRRMREIVRSSFKSLARPADVMIMAQSPAKEADFAELQADMQTLLVKCGLLPPRKS